MDTAITQTVEKIDGIEKSMAGKDLGNEIERLCAREGWSQEDLAGRIGLSQSRVSRMIKGEHNFPLETVYRLAVAFKINPFELAAIYWGIEVEQLSNIDKELLNNLLKLFDDYRKEIPSNLPVPSFLLSENKTPITKKGQRNLNRAKAEKFNKKVDKQVDNEQ